MSLRDVNQELEREEDCDNEPATREDCDNEPATREDTPMTITKEECYLSLAAQEEGGEPSEQFHLEGKT